MFIMFTVFTMSMSNFLRAMAEILLCIIHSMDQLVPTDQTGTGHVDQVQDEAHMARRQFLSKKQKISFGDINKNDDGADVKERKEITPKRTTMMKQMERLGVMAPAAHLRQSC